MKRTRPAATVLGILLSVMLLSAVAIAQQDTSEMEHEAHHAALQAQPSVGQSMSGDGMEMMGGGGMMGPGMRPQAGDRGNDAGARNADDGGGPGCMMGMQMMQMMTSDPKTRVQMMEIHSRMMKQMGELMEKRAQELEQSK
jgi:hypothetical protein